MNKTALITGASSGIGLELARLHAMAGGDLVLVARSTSTLHALQSEFTEEYGVEVVAIPKDLSIPDSPLELYEDLSDRKVEIEFLFNVAGFGDYSHFHKADWDKLEMMINVNMLTLTHLTYLFGEDMVERGHGHVLNVSCLEVTDQVLMSTYQATKQYVSSFTKSLREEWQPLGVQVVELCPGPTKTNFQARASAPVPDQPMASAREVATEGYRMLTVSEAPAASEGMNKVLAGAMRWLPKGIRKTLGADNE